MPEHHFPTGVTLSLARRATLLQLAEQQDALILEDDYDSEFYYDRHPRPERVDRPCSLVAAVPAPRASS
jgi:GntR family transcriptional regulator / MocR family aminotransferase